MNGAFLAVKLGPIQFQPAEFAKIGIIVFLASYLRETGDMLVRAAAAVRSRSSARCCCRRPGAARPAADRRPQAGHCWRRCCSWCSSASLVAIMRERPSLKHFGPLLLVWGLAMLMLLVIRDLGSSLMFFGGFLALLYVATGTAVAGGGGGGDVPRRRGLLRHNVAATSTSRVETWLDTFSQAFALPTGGRASS